MLDFNQNEVEVNKPSRKKPIYPINTDLRKYLVKYGRYANPWDQGQYRHH